MVLLDCFTIFRTLFQNNHLAMECILSCWCILLEVDVVDSKPDIYTLFNKIRKKNPPV